MGIEGAGGTSPHGGIGMEALRNVDLASLLDTLLSLGTAFLLGGLIGFERQYLQRTAGLRTNLLVALGAALFVDSANRLQGHEGGGRWSIE